jgi:hypothetical protein
MTTPVSIRGDANHCANVLPNRIGIRDGAAGIFIKALLSIAYERETEPKAFS